MIMIFLGPPGAGKGTYAKGLKDKLNIPHISTGDILRSTIEEGTEIGKKVKETLKKGKLVSDEAMMDLVAARVEQDDAEEGFILDGFPRTLQQAKMLDDYLLEEGLKVDLIIDFDLEDEKLIRRLVNRRQCPKCGRIYNMIGMPPKNDELCDVCNIKLETREDDKEEIVKRRLRIYKRKTQPLVDYYSTREEYHKFEHLERQEVETVVDSIMELIRNDNIEVKT
ncbi:adenylate kinase [bacterium]|nr:adenylate kinase [bacterium]